MNQRLHLFFLGCVILALFGSDLASAQDQADAQRFFPRQGYLLTGYGGAGYQTLFAEDSQPNDFSAIFAPIMLFQVSDRFLFEGELEFEIEEEVTATSLEYAQVDMALSNNLTLVAGKFLLPFNTFSERLHPTWINRLVSAPALYGGHGALTPTDPLLPVLSDVGVQLRGAFNVGRFRTITAEAFITQGPMQAADEHDEDGDEEGDGHDEGTIAAKAVSFASGGGSADPGSLAFGGDFTDNNEDKLIGGRLGFGIAPYFEVNVSGMTAAFDPAGDLRFSALGAHVEGRHRSITVHGEFIQTWQDIVHEDDTDTLTRNGYWVQTGYRWGKWQPVARWTQLFEGDIDGEVVTDAGQQLALGLDYWFEPAVVVKVEYLINEEEHSIDNNRLAIQIAFGF